MRSANSATVMGRIFAPSGDRPEKAGGSGPDGCWADEANSGEAKPAAEAAAVARRKSRREGEVDGDGVRIGRGILGGRVRDVKKDDSRRRSRRIAKR